MTDRRVDFLAQLPLLCSVDPAALAELVPALKRRVYKKGEFIYHDGDGANGLFIVLKGAIKTHLTSPTGKQLTVGIMRTGRIFGQYSLFGETRGASALALEEAELLFLEREVFLKSLRDYPEATFALLHQMSASRRNLTQRLYDVAMLDLPTRVAKALSDFPSDNPSSDDHIGSLAEYLTQGELAGLVASTRESVNQCLRLFARQGLIKVDRGRIVILDPEKLRERSGPSDEWTMLVDSASG